MAFGLSRLVSVKSVIYLYYCSKLVIYLEFRGMRIVKILDTSNYEKKFYCICKNWAISVSIPKSWGTQNKASKYMRWQ